jgi:hypothetical protein
MSDADPTTWPVLPPTATAAENTAVAIILGVIFFGVAAAMAGPDLVAAVRTGARVLPRLLSLPVLVGTLGVGVSVYLALAQGGAGAAVELRAPTAKIRPGEPLRVAWRFPPTGRRRIRRVSLALVASESWLARVRDANREYRDERRTRAFLELPFTLVQGQWSDATGVAEARIAADAPASGAPGPGRNPVQWVVKLDTEVAVWPDAQSTFAVEVTGAAAPP